MALCEILIISLRKKKATQLLLPQLQRCQLRALTFHSWARKFRMCVRVFAFIILISLTKKKEENHNNNTYSQKLFISDTLSK